MLSPRLLLPLCAALCLAPSTASAAPFTAGNVVVCRVGDGAASLSANGNRVFLDEFTPSGTLVQSVALPYQDSSNLIMGNSVQEGWLTRTSDGRYLLLGGYNAQLPRTTSLDSSDTSIPRVAARIDRTGAFDLTTQIGSTSIVGELRSVASNNGTNLWFVNGTSGVRHVPFGGSSVTEISTAPSTPRQILVFNGQLYVSSTTGSVRLGQVGTNLPTTSGQSVTSLPGLPTNLPSWGGFFLADRDANVAGVDTLYLADEGANVIRKYSFDGSTWTARGTLALTGARCLTAVVNNSSVTLFMTAGTTSPSRTWLYTATDTAAFNATISATATLLVTATSNTAFRGVALAPVTASAVALEDFEAVETGTGTQLRWRTGWEAENLGFNVYRLENGERIRLNPQLIAGSALAGGPQAQAGYSYDWHDPAPGGAYVLEDLDLHGRSTWHGPFSARSAGRGEQPEHSRLLAAPLAIQAVYEGPVPRTLPALPPQVSAAALAGGAWIKIRVREEGWYRIPAGQLWEAGLPRRADPRMLRLWTEGREVAVELQGVRERRLRADGSLSFYGVGLDTPESDERIYWLTWGGSRSGRRIVALASAPARVGSRSFPYTTERRERSLYFAGALNGPEDNFFGAIVTSTPVSQPLRVTALDPNGPATLQVQLYGITDLAASPDHRVSVHLNGSRLGEVVYDGKRSGAGQFSFPAALLAEGENQVELRSEGPAPDASLVRSLRLTYPRRYVADGDRLRFLGTAGTRVRLEGFAAPPAVLDVTDPEVPLRIETVEQSGQVWLTIPGRRGSSRLLLASATPAAAPVERDAPSALSARSHRADFLILRPEAWSESLVPLQAARAAQGLRTLGIAVQDVYDEFGWGHPSPEALRRFLHHARTRWRGPPRFALLVGDATYDPRNYLGTGDRQWLPTATVEAGGVETASDDWLGDFNNDGIADLALGRLPARSAEECAALVAKVLSFDGSGFGLFLSDADDGFLFQSASDRAASAFGGETRSIRRGERGNGPARAAFLSALAERPDLVSYSGHGNIDFWRGGVLDLATARSLPAGSGGTVWLAMTCLNAYFTSPTLESLGEALLRNPQGGAAAVWAGSTFCSAESQARAQEVFVRELASGATLGDAAVRAKRQVHDRDLRLSFILLGDPTQRIR